MENDLASKYFFIELNLKKNKKNILISLEIIHTCQKMSIVMVKTEKLHYDCTWAIIWHDM